MDRGAVGWVQKGLERSPNVVNFTRVFNAPAVKFLMLWYGNRIISLCCYDVMNGETAKNLCARRG